MPKRFSLAPTWQHWSSERQRNLQRKHYMPIPKQQYERHQHHWHGPRVPIPCLPRRFEGEAGQKLQTRLLRKQKLCAQNWLRCASKDLFEQDTWEQKVDEKVCQITQGWNRDCLHDVCFQWVQSWLDSGVDWSNHFKGEHWVLYCVLWFAHYVYDDARHLGPWVLHQAWRWEAPKPTFRDFRIHSRDMEHAILARGIFSRNPQVRAQPGDQRLDLRQRSSYFQARRCARATKLRNCRDLDSLLKLQEFAPRCWNAKHHLENPTDWNKYQAGRTPKQWKQGKCAQGR